MVQDGGQPHGKGSPLTVDSPDPSSTSNARPSFLAIRKFVEDSAIVYSDLTLLAGITTRGLSVRLSDAPRPQRGAAHFAERPGIAQQMVLSDQVAPDRTASGGSVVTPQPRLP